MAKSLASMSFSSAYIAAHIWSSSANDAQGTRLGSLICVQSQACSASYLITAIALWLYACNLCPNCLLRRPQCSTCSPYDPDTSNDYILVGLMPKLDTRGILAAAEIAFYAPLAALTLILIFRYAFRRDAGWFFLFIFSISDCRTSVKSTPLLIQNLGRIAEGALLVSAESITPPKPVLFNAAYIIDYSALAALLLSSLGFIGMA